MSGGTEAEVPGSISKCTPHRAFSCSFEDGSLKKSLLALITPVFFPLLASPCLPFPLLSSPFPEITGLYSPFCSSLLISLTVFPDARGGYWNLFDLTFEYIISASIGNDSYSFFSPRLVIGETELSELFVGFSLCVWVYVGKKKRNGEKEASQSVKWKAGEMCCLKTLSSGLINVARQSNFALVQAGFVSGRKIYHPPRVHALFSPHHYVLLPAIQIILRMASLLKRALTVHRVLAFCQG